MTVPRAGRHTANIARDARAVDRTRRSPAGRHTRTLHERRPSHTPRAAQLGVGENCGSTRIYPVVVGQPESGVRGAGSRC